jgi:hypothetical protein
VRRRRRGRFIIIAFSFKDNYATAVLTLSIPKEEEEIR